MWWGFLAFPICFISGIQLQSRLPDSDQISKTFVPPCGNVLSSTHTAKSIHRKQKYILKLRDIFTSLRIWESDLYFQDLFPPLQDTVYYFDHTLRFFQYYLKIGFPSSSLNQRMRLGCSLDDALPVLVSQGSVALCPATTFIDVPFTSEQDAVFSGSDCRAPERSENVQ